MEYSCFAITAFMHLGMPSTSLSHCFWITLCHSWHKNASSSALFDGLCPFIFLLITFKRFAIWFRSGDRAGHDKVLVKTLIDLGMWHGALCCWKKRNPQGLRNIVTKRTQICFQDNLCADAHSTHLTVDARHCCL